VTVLDASGGIATAKAVSADYIDYAHLVKIDGQWKIVNVLDEARFTRVVTEGLAQLGNAAEQLWIH
jgi:hypothetical protein